MNCAGNDIGTECADYTVRVRDVAGRIGQRAIDTLFCVQPSSVARSFATIGVSWRSGHFDALGLFAL